MHYRRFGRTDLQMPVFSCGGMRYQYKWQDVSPWQVPRDYAKERYSMLGNGSHWFPGSKADRINPQTLKPYLQNSPHADQIPAILQETHQLLAGQDIKRLSQQ